MFRPPFIVPRTVAVLTTMLACTSVLAGPPARNGTSTSAAAPATTAAPPGREATPALKPYAEVIKDAQEHAGFFRIYQKDEKVWLEVNPDQLDRPFFLQVNRATGVGDRELFTNPMVLSHVVELRKIGNLVQLIAKNPRFLAKEGTALARAAREALSDSLLAAAPVVSKPHPESKSVLIDANALLLVDMPAGATALENVYRLGYAFDARNSSFAKVRATDDATVFKVIAHYAVPKLPARPATPNPLVPQPTAPRLLEDPRSLFIHYVYSLAKLPEPMQARVADDRLGHFTTRKWDFSTDLNPFPETYLVNRWRLEKKDPDAALSEPKQAIVYWLDRNIPEQYRETVKAGILEWNKAFERIGFAHAIRVEQQSDDAEFDTSDTRHASVRWVLRHTETALAIGPTRVDPRTGEILDADIEIEDGWTRLPRRVAAEQYPRVGSAMADLEGYCNYGAEAADETSFALDLLAARGDIDPDSPEAERIVLATLKSLVTHEVGHTLGLQHNFRASTIYTPAQLADPEFTQKNGLGGSVMDYNATNLAVKGETQGEYVMSTIGPYDYWAIEYAYKPLPSDREKEELARLAARSNEPQLAFGNDLDAGFGGPLDGMDPEVNRRDLGNDPLSYVARRIKLSRELWDRLQDKRIPAGESYNVLRRNFLSGLTQFGSASEMAAKFIGGVVYVRDHAGSGREPFTPVPAERQRAALKFIAENLFSVDSFQLKPDVIRRMTVDQFDRTRPDADASAIAPDISLSTRLLNVQRNVLDKLMSDAVAVRLTEGEVRHAKVNDAFRLSELYDTLQDVVWSELKSGRDIPSYRRNLQREHLKRITATLLKPSALAQADARALQRQNARKILKQIRVAQNRATLSAEAKAHLLESANTLDEALKAPMARAGAYTCEPRSGDATGRAAESMRARAIARRAEP